MSATLVINQPGHPVRKVEVGQDAGAVVSIGRAPDNIVSLAGDTDASRYHAVIEPRQNDFIISDLGSTNGTFINGAPVRKERSLQHGDLISFGQGTRIEFRLSAEAIANQAAALHTAHEAGSPTLPPQSATRPKRDRYARTQDELAVTGNDPPALSPARHDIAAAPPKSGSFSPYLIAGGLGALLAVSVVLVVLFATGTFSSSSNSRGRRTARGATSNTNDATGTNTTADDTSRANQQANASTPNNTDAGQPTTGGATNGTGEGSTTSSETPTDAGDSTANTSPAAPVSAQDVQTMAQQFASDISGQKDYVFTRELTELIKKRTGEYASVRDAYERARTVRREISYAYSEKGLPPALGFALAFSRSKFDRRASGGLWAMTAEIAVAGSLKEGEQPQTAFADARRSAEISANYTKSLVGIYSVPDFMYAVAGFGSSVDQAGVARTELAKFSDKDRRDFWAIANSGALGCKGSIEKCEAVDRVARFFAAAIVAEHPEKFGLSGKPMSELWK